MDLSLNGGDRKMFGLGFIELLGIILLIILFVKPKDYKTIYVQLKKLQYQLDSFGSTLHNEIMLLDEPDTETKKPSL